MYLTRVRIEHIRSIASMDWRCPEGKEAGWHVVIGDNGAGKSTFLRSIALALIEHREASALRLNWNDWLRHGVTSGRIILDVSYDSEVDKGLHSASNKQGHISFLVGLSREDPSGDHASLYRASQDRDVLSDYSGWFSASYGPFRRFTGGDQEYERLLNTYHKLAPHLSIFGENVALTECLSWLRELQFKKLEKDPEGQFLDLVKSFVNQAGFLPHQACLDNVSSKGVEFVDGNGYKLQVEELSDGYRSVLSMTFELIRQLARAYGPGRVFDPEEPTKVIVPGVVLIDEIDAHLHPTWQRRIGIWFREHFPNIQFIVTTHSPLICQAADVGTVWQLPQPGSDASGGMVTGRELDRLVYGNVLDAYSTEVFGADVTRSDASKKRLQRLAELNMKEFQGALTDSEQQEQEQLRAAMPTSAHQVD